MQKIPGYSLINGIWVWKRFPIKRHPLSAADGEAAIVLLL